MCICLALLCHQRSSGSELRVCSNPSILLSNSALLVYIHLRGPVVLYIFVSVHCCSCTTYIVIHCSLPPSSCHHTRECTGSECTAIGGCSCRLCGNDMSHETWTSLH